jgi:hypothetical protein
MKVKKLKFLKWIWILIIQCIFSISAWYDVIHVENKREIYKYDSDFEIFLSINLYSTVNGWVIILIILLFYKVLLNLISK